ncbi:hypothetical protein VTK73DRAFT_9366 [Phialemonium thermophilum]|uniref:Uncharacterized protein n=1 Tax=Phialemonium thermophilum TaxID=223376 RepID=A0ABR3W337_9PEZI
MMFTLNIFVPGHRSPRTHGFHRAYMLALCCRHGVSYFPLSPLLSSCPNLSLDSSSYSLPSPLFCHYPTVSFSRHRRLCFCSLPECASLRASARLSRHRIRGSSLVGRVPRQATSRTRDGASRYVCGWPAALDPPSKVAGREQRVAGAVAWWSFLKLAGRRVRAL